jgi:hypothetical protein
MTSKGRKSTRAQLDCPFVIKLCFIMATFISIIIMMTRPLPEIFPLAGIILFLFNGECQRTTGLIVVHYWMQPDISPKRFGMAGFKTGLSGEDPPQCNHAKIVGWKPQ